MNYIDIHTHHPSEGAVIQSVEPSAFHPVSGFWYSVGFHPWYLKETWEDELPQLAEILRHPSVLAVGECGLDKCVTTDWRLQMQAFEAQIRLSEEVGKPLVLHVVKAYNEMMQVRRSLSPRQPWIVHGFRGKPELAVQLLREGLYLSVGTKCADATIQAIPLSRLFLETDESEEPIAALYQRVARLKSVPLEQLLEQISMNARILWK